MDGFCGMAVYNLYVVAALESWENIKIVLYGFRRHCIDAAIYIFLDSKLLA